MIYLYYYDKILILWYQFYCLWRRPFEIVKRLPFFWGNLSFFLTLYIRVSWSWSLLFLWKNTWIFSFSINGLGKIAVNQKMLQEFLGHYPFAIILLAVAGAFTEEVIYRGILFEFFYKAGQTASVLLTAFLFGFIHILSTIKLGDFNGILDLILKLLPYFMMGLALALEYVKYKNIWINIFTHVLWNIIACLMSIVVMKFLPFMK